MKKHIFVLLLSACTLGFGCGGQIQANLDTQNPESTAYFGKSFSLLPPPGPRALADANYRNSQAAINRAIAEQMLAGAGEFSAKGKFTGVIINIDPQKTMLVKHPELDESRPIRAGESSFYFLDSIPKYIYVQFEGENRTRRAKVYECKEKKHYNGRKVDFGAQIHS